MSWVSIPPLCYESYLQSAAEFNIRLPRDADFRARVQECFEMLAVESISVNDLPSPQQFLEWWRDRPMEAPLYHNTEVDELIAGIADGISKKELQAWRRMAASIPDEDRMDKLTANTMLASVEWWTSQSELEGLIPWGGVSADLSAMSMSANPAMVAIASAAGVIADLATVFENMH